MASVEPPTFITETQRGPGLVAYIVQQVGVPLGSIVLLLLVPAFRWSFVGSGITGQIMEVTRGMIIASAVGLIGGLMVRRVAQGFRTTGRWIWVLPVFLYVLAFLQDSFTFSVKTALRESFLPGPDGEQWWTFYFFTCPTLSTALYSAAISWRKFERVAGKKFSNNGS